MKSVKTRLSQRVVKMEESATIKMSQLARELRSQGKDVISLSLGEPDFDTPEYIKEAANRALQDGYTKYTPVPGLIQLREAICTKLKRDNKMDFDPSQIVVSNGAKQCIANICAALLDDGDEAVVFSPFWVSYEAIIKLNGGIPVSVFAGIAQDFKVQAAQLEAAISERTKFIIFSSPCNPTGSVYTQSELEALAKVIAKYPSVQIISDEIYEYINFTGKHASIGSIAAVKDQTITVNGFSKGFAMTGWRLGYMAGPKHIMKACSKIQSQCTSGANSFSQMAGVHALLNDRGPSEKMKAAFEKRRDLVIGLLKEIPGMKVNLPMGAFYVFPDISSFYGKTFNGVTINNSVDFCEYLLNSAYVAVVPGSAFGDDHCFRLSYAASEKELIEAISRIKKALA